MDLTDDRETAADLAAYAAPLEMAEGRIHVYVGPTCPANEILQRFPDVVIHPPASHGDFFSSEIESGDVAVVVP